MESKNRISCQALLFDLEGVLVHGKKYQILPGAREILEFLTSKEIQFKVVTNNTTETPESLLELLGDRELFLSPAVLQTPLSLLKTHVIPQKRYRVLGSEKVESFIKKYGGKVSMDSDADTVVCGGGYKMESTSLSSALDALLESNANLVTLHRNRLFTDENGKRQMCTGAVVAALEYSSGITATNLGKPSREYFAAATRNFRKPIKNTLLVSDDPFSDLEGAQQLGFKTAFILTGKYKAEILPKLSFTPNFVVSDLSELLERLET